MSSYHRCPKCNSGNMIDGAFMGGPQGPRLVVGVERHPDHGRLARPASTQIHASLCGFVELYANQPGELYNAYSHASRQSNDPAGDRHVRGEPDVR